MVKDSPPFPKILSQKWLNHSHLFHVEQLDLRFSNGVERVYERLNPGAHGAVMVVPLLDAETVLLVREYGAGIGQYYVSLPKGAMDAGETPAATANRELKEEAGYGAKDISLLTQLSLSPSYMGHRMHILLAQDLYPARLLGDEPEPLEVISWPLNKLSELIARDDFCEAYAVAALLMVKDMLDDD